MLAFFFRLDSVLSRIYEKNSESDNCDQAQKLVISLQILFES